MSLKAKLTAMIMALIFSLSMMIVGVLSAVQVNLGISGNVTFIAKGVNCTISEGSLNTGDKPAGSMKGFTYSTSTAIDEGAETDFKNSWLNLDLTFEEHGEGIDRNQLIISFTIKNNSTSESLAVKITTKSLGENKNEAMKDIVVSSPAMIAPGATENYSLTFEPKDNEVSGKLTGFNIQYLIEKAEPLAVDMKYDLGFPYMTMGTKNSQPIKWRYVGYREGVSGNYTYKYSRNPLPGQTAVFVVEDNIGPNLFGINSEVNDYVQSGMRDYLNSNFISEINLTSDINYSKIVSRDISELYKDIKWNHSTGAISNGTTSATGSDKFWLLSVKEAYNLLGNHSATNIVDPNNGWNDNAFLWGGYGDWGFRSPYYGTDYSVYGIAKGSVINWQELMVYAGSYRAAFLINI